MTNIFVSKVQMVEGQLTMLFQPELLEKLNLKDNELLVWELNEDKITITKKVLTTDDQ